MNRKRFIRTCGILAAGTSVAGLAWSGCGTTQYLAGSSLSGNRLVIRKSEFVIKRGRKNKMRKFVIAVLPGLEFPVCIYRLADDHYVALDTRCPHRGCGVNAMPHLLVCPCHGSEFSTAGKVLRPPAEDDLTQYILTHDDETLYVHL